MVGEYIIESEKLIEANGGINMAVSIARQRGQVTAPAHIHSQIEALYITSGSFNVSVNGQSVDVDKGDFIVLPKYSIHSVICTSSGGGKYYYLQVHPVVISEMAESQKVSIFQFFFSEEFSVCKFLWREKELKESLVFKPLMSVLEEYNNRDYFFGTSLKIKLCGLLVAVMREAYAHNRFSMLFPADSNMLSAVQKATEYINSNYEKDISAKEVAGLCGYSYKYFLQCFSKIMGEGFSQYLNKTRINYAKSMLVNSSKSINEIAQAVGYNSNSYFIFEFRRRTGMTPLQFVKEERRN